MPHMTDAGQMSSSACVTYHSCPVARFCRSDFQDGEEGASGALTEPGALKRSGEGGSSLDADRDGMCATAAGRRRQHQQAVRDLGL